MWSAAVAQWPHHPKVKGLSPASTNAGNGICSRRHDFQHKDIQNNDTQQGLFVTLSITKICNHSHYAECRISFTIMLNVIMLSVIMLNVIMMSVIMMSVIMLSVIMLSVVGLIVVMKNVVAPIVTPLEV